MHRDFHNLADLSRKDSPLGHRDRLIRSPRLMHKFPTEKTVVATVFHSVSRVITGALSILFSYWARYRVSPGEALVPLPETTGLQHALHPCVAACHPPTLDAHAARTGENPDRDGVGLTSVGRGREARDEAARGSNCEGGCRRCTHVRGLRRDPCSLFASVRGVTNQLTAVTVTDPRVPRFSPTKRNT